MRVWATLHTWWTWPTVAPSRSTRAETCEPCGPPRIAEACRIAYAADTHLHADFLSGAVQLAADDGATVLASAAGDREFPHRGLSDGTRSTSAI